MEENKNKRRSRVREVIDAMRNYGLSEEKADQIITILTAGRERLQVSPLTEKQKIVLDFVRKYINEKGHAPSLKDIADGLGYANRMTVHQHLCHLRKKGYVDWLDGFTRSLRVIE